MPQPVVDHEADEVQRRQIRHLVRLHQHQRARDACGKAVTHRGAIERTREQGERDGEEHEALDLADVLDAPRRRGAEHETECRHDPARRMPAAVAEVHQHRDAGEREQHQHCDVERVKARMRREQRQQRERREDQRLRIGDLRNAAEHVGRPERRLALMDRVGEELQLGLEQRLGVIRNGHRPGEPGPGQREPCENEQRDRKRSIETHPERPPAAHFSGSLAGNFRLRT